MRISNNLRVSYGTVKLGNQGHIEDGMLQCGGASEVKNSEEREMATLGYKVIKRADA